MRIEVITTDPILKDTNRSNTYFIVPGRGQCTINYYTDQHTDGDEWPLGSLVATENRAIDSYRFKLLGVPVSVGSSQPD